MNIIKFFRLITHRDLIKSELTRHSLTIINFLNIIQAMLITTTLSIFEKEKSPN